MAHDRTTNEKPAKPKIPTKPLHLKKNATCGTIKVNKIQPYLTNQYPQLIVKRAASLDFIKDPNFKENKQVKSPVIRSKTENIPSPNYVEINLPQVQPGTIIRTDSKTGELTKKPARQIRTSHNFKQKSIKNGQKIGQNLLKNRQSYDPKSPENEPNNNYLKTDSLDENGYEMPICMSKNIYFAFDSVTSSNMTSSADETDAYEDAKALQRYRKKKRHNRRNDAALQDFHQSALIKNTSQHTSLSSEECCQGYHHQPQTNHVTPNSDVTKINSFLSTRLQQTVHVRCESRDSPSDVFSSSNEGSDWFSSDESECCDCYYQQIEPPATKFVDHDYEDIEESDDADLRKKSKKTVRKMVVSAVRGRKKLKQRSSDPLTSPPNAVTSSPKLSRRNVLEVMSTTPTSGGGSWADISTPGVLKFKEFRELGKSNSLSDISKY